MKKQQITLNYQGLLKQAMKTGEWRVDLRK